MLNTAIRLLLFCGEKDVNVVKTTATSTLYCTQKKSKHRIKMLTRKKFQRRPHC